MRAASGNGAALTDDVRRRPTLPRGPPRSTIGAEGLNFRVRNGTGCFPFAMATETLWRFKVLRTCGDLRLPGCGRPHLGNRTVAAKSLPGSYLPGERWSIDAAGPISAGQL